MATRKSTNNIIALAIFAILLLLGTTGYLWIQNNNLKKEVLRYNNEINTLYKTQVKLEKDYDLAIANLDELKGDNQELNLLIENQKNELRKQKDKISTLIWKSKKLNEARAEIENLKAQALDFVQEINDLKEQNVVLTGANQKLQKDKIELSQQLELTTSEKAAIQREKDSLLTIKEKLEKDKKKLFFKANKASVLLIDDLSIKGYLVKDNGKYSKRRKAKNIELLKICFDIKPNEITDKAEEVFYIRIIGPDGVTLYNESVGSGIMTKSIDATKMKYTKKYNVDYSGYDENICLIWNKDLPLQKGTYKLEIYNKGYLSGEKTFKLR